MLRVCVLLSFVCVNARTLTGKGFFCRDPDTGMLHPINTTWPAQMSCGNYHCKMRRKNVTQSQYGLYRTYNVSNVFLGSKTVLNTPATLFRKNYGTTTDNVNRLQNKTDYNNDRFLTESEIKSITDLLHKVKKSDLDAIVELYNFAQEYYQLHNNYNETVPKIDVKSIMGVQPHSYSNRKSYWYEPFTMKMLKTAKDVDVKGLNQRKVKPTSARPMPARPISARPIKPRNKFPTYFSGPLHSKDFRQLPYFYPISNFQRLYSYVKDQTTNQAHPPGNVPSSYPQQRTYHNTVHRSHLLPLPFSIPPNIPQNIPQHIRQHNNTKHRPPVPQHKKQNQTKNFHIHGKAVHSQESGNIEIKRMPSKAFLVNPFLEETQSGISVNEPAINFDDKLGRPSWKTNDLPPEVIKDVRANVNENRIILSLPFRKKITLEKVDNMVYETLPRSKRQISNINATSTEAIETDLYEVYIEKTTCQTDNSVPGYFRRGNMSLSFPGCCPQRIDN